VLVVKSPPEIIYTGLRRVIGAPSDFSTNRSQPANFDRRVDLTVPISETNEKKVYKVGGAHTSDDDLID
jgi:hypothetical protein